MGTRRSGDFAAPLLFASVSAPSQTPTAAQSPTRPGPPDATWPRHGQVYRRPQGGGGQQFGQGGWSNLSRGDARAPSLDMSWGARSLGQQPWDSFRSFGGDGGAFRGGAMPRMSGEEFRRR